ncbi:hypothetical protein PENARI_c022G02883 [Penicillium arizonense]|uniref:Uncharacterized protein n=1 Tax=Penicillium arizonense TaxID=1835702 RepID=A0A1F5L7M9_PENAI|nr:hypothetical protein PENARI_c022G02883 [Penicillium arizonense]OGE49223.1 hypothetical protein PENARI_c022G02883 [Penicillium arizonense]
MPESPKPESLKFEPRRRVQHRQFKSHRYLNYAGPSWIIQPQPIPSHPNQNLPNQCLPNQLQQWIKGLGDGIRLWHVESGQLIRSVFIFKIKTTNPENQPLRSFELF